MSLLSNDVVATNTVAPEQTSELVSNNVTESQPNKLYIDEGIEIDGNIPEWFDTKYKTVAEQVKAYKEFESKAKAFTGAPEVYEGSEQFAQDALFNKVSSVAKELNMSNEAFNKLLNAYSEYAKDVKIKYENEDKEFLKTEREKLGDKADNIINELETWGKNNFDENEYKILRGMATSSDAVKLLSKIKSMAVKNYAQEQPVGNINGAVPASEDLYKMINDPKYKTDSAYRDHVLSLYIKREQMKGIN